MNTRHPYRHALAKLLALLALSIWLPAASAVLPDTLNYQGRLANSSGQPVNDATANLTIRLYNVAAGGSVLWSETHVTNVVAGLFSVDLGIFVALDPALFSEPLWIGITAGNDSEMTPRNPLTNVPFVYTAHDADTVDGMHASELIDAATDEVRMPIASLPFTIDVSGTYYLTGSLSNANGIDVTVDDVTIDLMGFTLTGTGAADHGINLDGQSNVTIMDGTIRGFGLAGIYQSNSSARYSRALDMRVFNNGAAGSQATASGIYLNGTNNLVDRCTAADNSGHGIYAGWSSNIIGNSVKNNAGFFGIYGGRGTTISGNTVSNHLADRGIMADLGVNISNNTVYANQRWGIYGGFGNTIRNNTITGNNASNTAAEGGLRVSPDSQVIGNTLNSNFNLNMTVVLAGSVIKDNLVTNSTTGIFFSAGNYYADNQASGNTADFAGTVPIGVADGGGNVGF